jgi:hypothetical protein
MTSPQNHPFFSLVNNQCQAEAALAALMCCGSQEERRHFEPEVLKLKREWLHAEQEFCLAEKINGLIANYVENVGELSDQLIIFISKSFKH